MYGNDGYAFYFILLERIYRTSEAELAVSDAETIQILARKVSVTMEKFEQMLQAALKWKCFDRENYEKRGVLTSNGIKKRASVVIEKRVAMREKYRKQRVGGSQDISDAETTEETTPETPQSKEKKSKEKKRKVKERKGEEREIKEVYRTIQHLPLYVDEYNKLRENYSESDISDILDEMENWAKLKTKRSAYLTANNWLKDRQRKREQEQQKPSYRPNVQKALDLS